MPIEQSQVTIHRQYRPEPGAMLKALLLVLNAPLNEQKDQTDPLPASALATMSEVRASPCQKDALIELLPPCEVAEALDSQDAPPNNILKKISFLQEVDSRLYALAAFQGAEVTL